MYNVHGLLVGEIVGVLRRESIEKRSKINARGLGAARLEIRPDVSDGRRDRGRPARTRERTTSGEQSSLSRPTRMAAAKGPDQSSLSLAGPPSLASSIYCRQCMARRDKGRLMGKAAKAHFDDARWILPGERDHVLSLNDEDWPGTATLPAGWDAGQGHLYRIIDARWRGPAKPLATSLKESILRFPSAPMHGVHRLHAYHNNLPTSDSFHTYRILTSPNPPRKLTRIFLFHNGLNELDRMGLYY
jgi:hypothetical protein